MVAEETIRELAYSLWEKEGRPEGKDTEHYFTAKQMLEQPEAAKTRVGAGRPAATAARPPTGARAGVSQPRTGPRPRNP